MYQINSLDAVAIQIIVIGIHYRRRGPSRARVVANRDQFDVIHRMKLKYIIKDVI